MTNAAAARRATSGPRCCAIPPATRRGGGRRSTSSCAKDRSRGASCAPSAARRPGAAARRLRGALPVPRRRPHVPLTPMRRESTYAGSARHRVAYLVTLRAWRQRNPAAYRSAVSRSAAAARLAPRLRSRRARMARALARALGATLVVATVSRLLVELNRSPGRQFRYSPVMRDAPRGVRAEACRRLLRSVSLADRDVRRRRMRGRDARRARFVAFVHAVARRERPPRRCRLALRSGAQARTRALPALAARRWRSRRPAWTRAAQLSVSRAQRRLHVVSAQALRCRRLCAASNSRSTRSTCGTARIPQPTATRSSPRCAKRLRCRPRLSAQMLVEERERARPRELRRGFVVARRRVVVEAVIDVRDTCNPGTGRCSPSAPASHAGQPALMRSSSPA